MRHSAIYFVEIYLRQLGLSYGSCDSLNTHFESSINGDKTMLSQMCSQDFRLLQEMSVAQPQSQIYS